MTKRLTVVAGAALIAAACGDPRTKALKELHGVQLSPVRAKADFKLEDTEGKPFDFRAATQGKVTLLYFGYTNCPDVCPTHMANIAAALRKLSPDDQSQIRVVFVTTDPARDTAAQLRGWLNNFDKRFIGLHGDVRDINQIETALGLPPSQMEQMPGMHDGPRIQSYGVGHAAQVLAFTPDDSLRAEYPSGFTVADWENDLPRLIRIK